MSSSQIPTRRGATTPRHRLRQAQSLLLSGPSSTSSSSRRRRSRSPESRIVSAHTNASQATEPTSNANRKKKGRSQLERFFPAIWPSSSSTLVEDSTDRGRKGKSKSKTLPRLPSENERFDLPKGGAATKSSASPADLSEDETDAASRTSVASYKGPFAITEFVRLKNENETLKKQLKQATKTINKQNKVTGATKLYANNMFPTFAIWGFAPLLVLSHDRTFLHVRTENSTRISSHHEWSFLPGLSFELQMR
ncbi:hypothetical protein JAAARDRAFT_164521 [Jaapia argillacea MUCL 33604]|uniref:Uncharacterized protein n=1 Tax=Jaapia argillacea MUCL 33604 TaxID=933084 RepID=A0A067PJU3_9AGAM|nr:hypothetical protein JAAARDRAFT_164521 [Jaapia argillacea MUCL 33604]